MKSEIQRSVSSWSPDFAGAQSGLLAGSKLLREPCPADTVATGGRRVRAKLYTPCDLSFRLGADDVNQILGPRISLAQSGLRLPHFPSERGIGLELLVV
jgi:hypothetical protein